jgi:NHL repeat
MRLAFALLLAIAVVTTPATAAAPKLKPLSIPRSAVVDTAWRAVISIRPGAKATLLASGPAVVRAPFTRTAKRSVYAASLRFPRPGRFTLAATVGGRRIGLGTVAVDIARDPLLLDPFTVAVEPAGTLLVGQLRRGGLVRISPGSPATTVVDRKVGHLTVSPAGTIYVLSDNAVFRLDGSSLTRIAGTGETKHAGDGGPALAASFDGVTSAAVDAAGSVYVAEYESWIRKITPDGQIATIAGTGKEGYSGDGGPAVAATFNHPHGLAMGPDGALYVGDTLNGKIRRIDLTTGRISTISDVGIVVSLAVAADGTIYATDVPGAGVGGGLTATAPGGSVTRLWTGDANGVAIASDGTLFVNGNETKRIFRFDPRTRRSAPVARG